MNNVKNRNTPSHEGNLNPMYGKRHDEVTKRKISDSQKARYAAMRDVVKTENISCLKQVIREELERMLNSLNRQRH